MKFRIAGLCWIIALVIISTVWAENWNIELVGKELSGSVDTVCVVDNHAYTNLGDTFVVLDVSDPTKPRQVGFCYTPGTIISTQVVKNYAYVAGEHTNLLERKDFFWVIDVSEPTTPHKVGFCDIPDETLTIPDFTDPFLSLR